MVMDETAAFGCVYISREYVANIFKRSFNFHGQLLSEFHSKKRLSQAFLLAVLCFLLF